MIVYALTTRSRVFPATGASCVRATTRRNSFDSLFKHGHDLQSRLLRSSTISRPPHLHRSIDRRSEPPPPIIKYPQRSHFSCVHNLRNNDVRNPRSPSIRLPSIRRQRNTLPARTRSPGRVCAVTRKSEQRAFLLPSPPPRNEPDNAQQMSTLLLDLSNKPSAAILDGLRGLERKTSLVFTLLKASVYSIVLNQQMDDQDGRSGGDDEGEGDRSTL